MVTGRRPGWLVPFLGVLALLIGGALAVGVKFVLGTTHATTTTTTTAGTTIPTTSTTSPTTSIPQITTTSTVILPTGVAVRSGFSPQSYSVVADGTIYILGTSTCGSTSCISLLRSTTGSQAWVEVPIPATSVVRAYNYSSQGVSKVRFATPAVGYLFGPSLYVTLDGGTHWSGLNLSDLAGGSMHTAVIDLEVRNGIAYLLAGPVLQGGVEVEQLYSSAVGSSQFMPVANVSTSSIAGGFIATYPFGTVVSLPSQSSAAEFVSTESLSSFTSFGSPCLSATVPYPALAPPDDTDALPTLFLSCAGSGSAGGEVKTVFISKNMGQSFQLSSSSPPISGGLNGFAAASSTLLAIGASSGGSYIYTSSNSGATWSTSYTNFALGGAPIQDLGFTNAHTGYAVVGYSLPVIPHSLMVVTHNGGESWQPITF